MKGITWRNKCNRKRYSTGVRSRKWMISALLIMLLICSYSLPVLAAQSTAVVTAKFTNLENIIASIISSIGSIVTLWGIFEFGNSMQTQEGGAQSQSLKRIGGGLVMVIAPQLLVLLV